MSHSKVHWGSLGLWWLLVSHLVVVAFLIWGFTTPVLDRANQILGRLSSPVFDHFSEDEIDVLARTLAEYPGLAKGLNGTAPLRLLEPTSDGWSTRPLAHAIIQSTPRRIRVEVEGEPSLFPLRLEVGDASPALSATLDGPGIQMIEWQQGAISPPSLVPVRLQPHNGSDSSAAHLRYRISAEESAPTSSIP